MTPLLTTRALTIGHRGHPLLPPIDLTVHPGEAWALVGRNGSGKTTLMRTLLGLHAPLGGNIEPADTLRIGYVPQRDSLDPAAPAHAVDLVRQGLDHGWSFLDPRLPRRNRAAVDAALAAVDAADLRHQPIHALSHGQRQRVLIARALVGDPTLLLLDEPTSAMDAVVAEAIHALLDRLRAERQLAILIASHHLDAVGRHATHALLLDRVHQHVTAGPAPEIVGGDAWRRIFGASTPAATP